MTLTKGGFQMGLIAHAPDDTVEFINSELLRCSHDSEFDNLSDGRKVDFIIDLISIIHNARSSALIVKGER